MGWPMFLKTFPYPKKNCYSKYIDSDSDSDSDGYGYGDGDSDGGGDDDGDRCHVTIEGQPWLHQSVYFEMAMLFRRPALATSVLLTTKLLDPGGKVNIVSKQDEFDLLFR